MLHDKLKAAGVAAQLVDIPGAGHLAGRWGSSSPKAQVAMNAVVDYLNAVNAKPVR